MQFSKEKSQESSNFEKILQRNDQKMHCNRAAQTNPQAKCDGKEDQ
jgi:hypothetical protein